MSVGGSAATGLQAGFDMGLRATAQEDARKQREFENARHTAADQQRSDQLARANTAQDKASAEHEDDRALSGVTANLEDARYQLGALHAKYGDSPIPDSEAKPLYEAVGQHFKTKQALLAKRYQPVVDATQQKWRDFASKAEAGQADPSTLRGQDLRDFIKATTGHDLSDYANGTVGNAINDATAGVESKNMSMAVRAAGTLLGPQIKQGLGATAPDGSTIINKDLYALVPAPSSDMQPGQQAPVAPLRGLMDMLNSATAPQAPAQGMQPGQQASVQPSAAGAAQMGAGPQPGQDPNAPAGSGTLTPGSDPNLLMPVLEVTTRQPDGRITTYHAPVTKGRGTDPNDELAKPLQMSELMDRMGRLGVVDNWLKTPQMADAVKEALAGGPTSFEQAWGMVHGDPRQLSGGTDPTSLKIAAIKKLAVDQGIDFADAARMFAAKSDTGIKAKLDAITSSDMSDEDKATATKAALGAIKVAAPKAAGGVDMSPAAIDQTAAAALKDRTALVGIGRDPNKVTAVLNRMAELSPGGDIAGNRALFGADKKSLDKMIPQYDAVVAFENNTLAQGKVLVDLAKKVDTTGVPVIERWIRAGRQAIAGDPDVTTLNAQLQLFGNEAAKILTNPNLTGVLSDSARHEVSDFLPKSATAPQIERVVSLLENDFEIRRKSIERQTDTITKRMAARQPAAAAGIGGNPGQVSPADQSARDNDVLKIQQQERPNILQRIADAQANPDPKDPNKLNRAQGDLAALDREIAKTKSEQARNGGGRAPGSGISGSPAAPKAPSASYASEKEAGAAAAAGKLKPGDRITINGQSGTWH